MPSPLTLRQRHWPLSIAKYTCEATVMEQGQSAFWSLIRTPDEVSVVCETAYVPDGAEAVNSGWLAFEVLGPLDFALTGIMASLTAPLAEARISVFALSTFDTDFLLIREGEAERACDVWSQSGFDIVR